MRALSAGSESTALATATASESCTESSCCTTVQCSKVQYSIAKCLQYWVIWYILFIVQYSIFGGDIV